MALFDVEGWADKQSSHFFLDDPVSSLEVHNIFVTVSMLYDLIEAHLALLRQVLENVASFLGVGQFRFVLAQIDINDATYIANISNTLSHKKVYYYESDLLGDDNRKMFDDVLNGLKEKYNLVLHAE